MKKSGMKLLNLGICKNHYFWIINAEKIDTCRLVI